MNSSLQYRSVDGIPVSVEFSTAFSQIMECDAELSSTVAQINVIPTGIYWEIPREGDGRTIRLEAHMLAQAVAYERTELHYIADAYSNTYELQEQCQEHVLSCTMSQSTQKENLRELLETPVPVNEVVFARATAGAATVLESGIELPLNVHMMCKNVNEELFAVKKKYKLLFRAEIGEGEQFCIGDCILSELYATPASGGVEIRLHAQLQILHILTSRIWLVSELARGEEIIDISQLPSLVIMRATHESDLWLLAKENCSTVEQIVELNGLRDNSEAWDKFILIPKHR